MSNSRFTCWLVQGDDFLAMKIRTMFLCPIRLIEGEQSSDKGYKQLFLDISPLHPTNQLLFWVYVKQSNHSSRGGIYFLLALNMSPGHCAFRPTCAFRTEQISVGLSFSTVEKMGRQGAFH